MLNSHEERLAQLYKIKSYVSGLSNSSNPDPLASAIYMLAEVVEKLAKIQENHERDRDIHDKQT